MRWVDQESFGVVVDCVCWRCEVEDWFFGGESLCDYLSDVVALFEAEDGVDAFYFVDELFAHALRKAACDDDFFDVARVFLFDGVFDGGDRFGFGGGDEAAGVYYNDVCVVGVGSDQHACLGDLGEHFFAVDDVFRTA